MLEDAFQAISKSSPQHAMLDQIVMDSVSMERMEETETDVLRDNANLTKKAEKDSERVAMVTGSKEPLTQLPTPNKLVNMPMVNSSTSAMVLHLMSQEE
jgi:hypothetical protein